MARGQFIIIDLWGGGGEGGKEGYLRYQYCIVLSVQRGTVYNMPWWARFIALPCVIIITPHTCARGKVFGFVCLMSVCLSVCQHNYHRISRFRHLSVL